MATAAFPAGRRDLTASDALRRSHAAFERCAGGLTPQYAPTALHERLFAAVLFDRRRDEPAKRSPLHLRNGPKSGDF